MKTITSNKTSNFVEIKKDAQGLFGCFLIQTAGLCGGRQVLDSKFYRSEKAALKWADKQLNA